MSVVFDPYHKWLGIPLRDQPPNHYRLLGIELFESDAEVIAHAADQRMAHLRVFQTGKHGKTSQRLLNEVATVKLCLLNPTRKAAYDEQLREKLASPNTVSAAPGSTAVAPVSEASTPPDTGVSAMPAESPARMPAAADNSPQMKLALEVFAAIGVLLIAICVVYSARQSRPSDSEQTAWHSDVRVPQAKPSVPLVESVPRDANSGGATASIAPPGHMSATPPLVSEPTLRPTSGGTGVSPALSPVTGKISVPSNPSDSATPRAATPPAKPTSVAAISGSLSDRGKPARPSGKTAAKKPDGPTYLDDLPELSSGVAIGILGKHGDTGYPQFESEYGPQVVFHGKKPEHALSTYPPQKGVSYVSYILKGEYRSLYAVAAIMEISPADAARVAAEPFFMGGPASPLTFKVIGDGRLLWESRPLAKSGDSQVCKVNIGGISLLELEVFCPDMNSYCWAAWIEPEVEK